MTPFGARLQDAMTTLGPLCAGLDPHRSLVEAWGLTYDVRGLERFAMTCVEAYAGRVAAVKPQSAFFERHGAKALVIGRFVPIVRTFITVVAGVSRMDRRHFLTWSAVGAVLWASGLTFLGYALGGIDGPAAVTACRAAGAHGVAVMGAIMRAARPGPLVARLLAAAEVDRP